MRREVPSFHLKGQPVNVESAFCHPLGLSVLHSHPRWLLRSAAHRLGWNPTQSGEKKGGGLQRWLLFIGPQHPSLQTTSAWVGGRRGSLLRLPSSLDGCLDARSSLQAPCQLMGRGRVALFPSDSWEGTQVSPSVHLSEPKPPSGTLKAILPAPVRPEKGK